LNMTTCHDNMTTLAPQSRTKESLSANEGEY
jgi:hypothetical protein